MVFDLVTRSRQFQRVDDAAPHQPNPDALRTLSGEGLVEAASRAPLDGRTGGAITAFAALFENEARFSAEWESAAILLCRRVRTADMPLHSLFTANQLRDLIDAGCLKLISHLVLCDPSKSIAQQLRSVGPVSDEVENAIRKGEGRPYSSAKRAIENFNGQAFHARSEGERAYCQALSLMYLLLRQGSRDHKIDWWWFSSPDTISAYLERQPRIGVTGRLPPGPITFLRDDRFGEFLVREFDRMFRELGGAREATQPQEVMASVVVLTPVHAMTVTLSVKVTEDGTRYAAYLFDPNRTTTHARACALDPKRFASHKLSDFILKRDGEGDRARAYFRCSADPGAEALFSIEEPILGRAAATRTETLDSGLAPTPRLAHMLMLNDASDAYKILLSRESPRPGRPMQDGDGRDAAELERLLQGDLRSERLPPGIFRAAIRRCSNVVTAYIDAVLESGLPRERQVALLRGDDGFELFHATLKSGSPDVVRAFCQGVTHSGLSDEEISRAMPTAVLLAGERFERSILSHFAEAASDGDTKMLMAFVEPVLTSPCLSEDSKIQLLRPESDRPSFSHLAREGGHPLTADAFDRAILDDPRLSLDAKSRILAEASSIWP
jgi:hypothetical protein